MVISHKKRFIFVHNYKVAGTSIRKALKGYNNRTFLTSFIKEPIPYLIGRYPEIYSSQFEHHINARRLKEKLNSDYFKSYFKFGFVRNPWDWQISLYNYMLMRPNHHQHDIIKKISSFDDYIDWRIENDLKLQRDFFYDDDELLINFVGKMENLNKDFGYVCDKVGIKGKLKRLNSSRKATDGILNYYTPDSFMKVTQAFEKDIKSFNYDVPEIDWTQKK